MALYSCSIKNIKRGRGASSVAKSAYNSRSRLEDTRTGNSYDYSRKQDLGFSEIITPKNAPIWVKDRQQLWANNELANKRRDARVAKEILVALPRELDINEQLYLVRKFVAENLTPLGVIADVNAHELDPNILPPDERENWNPHCHILISTQHLVDGEFGPKIVELNDRKFVIDLRKSWAELVNQKLEAIGSLERVDHRSHQARGIDKIPQIHLGHRVCQLRKRGIATDRGDRYEFIKERNREIETINSHLSDAIQQAKVKAASNHIETGSQQTVFNPEAEDKDLPLSIATATNEPVLEPLPNVDRLPQSKTERLIELYYGSDRQTVFEDVQTIKKLEKLGAKAKKSNSWLTIRLLDRNYTPEQIRRLLIHSEHTKELKFDEAERDINSNYQLALGVRQNEQRDSSIDNSASAKPVLMSFSPKNLSTASILFAIAKRRLETSTLKKALLSIGLDFDYNSKSHVFTLYEEGMPFYEYISGYYKTNSLGRSGSINIVKNDLPSSLNKEVMDVLFEFGFTASTRRRCPNWLKKITSKAEYGHEIPPAFFSLNRPESKISDSVQLDELDQQTVAVYYRPYKRLFNSQGEEIATSDSFTSLERQKRLEAWFLALGRSPEWSIEETLNDSPREPEQQADDADALVTRQTTIEPQVNSQIEKLEQIEPQTATPEKAEDVSPKQQQQQQKKSAKRIDATELIRMGLIRLPQYQLSRRKQQKLARRASALVAKILNLLKTRQTQDERFKISYDPKITRIQIIDVACQKDVLTASYHQGSSVWVADLNLSNLDEDVVRYLENKLKALQKPKTIESQSEPTSKFARLKMKEDKRQDKSPKLNRQKKKGFEL
ncbi:MAG: MobQ family relaxase [Cyanobacteria bacterium J06621_12]